MKKDKGTTFGDKIKFFDFYKDLPKDLAEPSVSGASGNTYKLFLNLNSISDCFGNNGCSIHLCNKQLSILLEDK